MCIVYVCTPLVSVSFEYLSGKVTLCFSKPNRVCIHKWFEGTMRDRHRNGKELKQKWKIVQHGKKWQKNSSLFSSYSKWMSFGFSIECGGIIECRTWTEQISIFISRRFFSAFRSWRKSFYICHYHTTQPQNIYVPDVIVLNWKRFAYSRWLFLTVREWKEQSIALLWVRRLFGNLLEIDEITVLCSICYSWASQ